MWREVFQRGRREMSQSVKYLAAITENGKTGLYLMAANIGRDYELPKIQNLGYLGSNWL